MTITSDSIGIVITQGDITRRYCNFNTAEAIADFKWFLYLTGRGAPII